MEALRTHLECKMGMQSFIVLRDKLKTMMLSGVELEEYVSELSRDHYLHIPAIVQLLQLEWLADKGWDGSFNNSM